MVGKSLMVDEESLDVVHTVRPHISTFYQLPLSKHWSWDVLDGRDVLDGSHQCNPSFPDFEFEIKVASLWAKSDVSAQD